MKTAPRVGRHVGRRCSMDECVAARTSASLQNGMSFSIHDFYHMMYYHVPRRVGVAVYRTSTSPVACGVCAVVGDGVTVSGTIKRYGVRASAVPATVACVSVFMARFTAGAGPRSARRRRDATSCITERNHNRSFFTLRMTIYQWTELGTPTSRLRSARPRVAVQLPYKQCTNRRRDSYTPAQDAHMSRACPCTVADGTRGRPPPHAN